MCIYLLIAYKEVPRSICTKKRKEPKTKCLDLVLTYYKNKIYLILMINNLPILIKLKVLTTL